MKALVTGPGGFIGSTLIEELDTLGFEVQVLNGDLTCFESLCRATQKVDYIFHLAEVSKAHRSATYFESNTKNTERLARAAVRSGSSLTRFVYVSSVAAAGPSSSLKPRVERDPERPVSDYGKSKLAGEKELLKFKKDIPISIVRPSLVYGPGDRESLVFFQAIARNLMPVLYGSNRDGNKYFSAIHSKDLCRGIVQAAVAPKQKITSGEVFYLSGDGIHTYHEFMSAIAERLNSDPYKIRIPKLLLRSAALGLKMAGGVVPAKWVSGTGPFPLNSDRMNEIFCDYWVCSNQKAKRKLGFEPEFDLMSGLTHCIEWYRRHKWI